MTIVNLIPLIGQSNIAAESGGRDQPDDSDGGRSSRDCTRLSSFHSSHVRQKEGPKIPVEDTGAERALAYYPLADSG